MSFSSRRDFLGLSARAALALSGASLLSRSSLAATVTGGSSPRAWQTGGKLRLAPITVEGWKAQSALATNPIALEPGHQKQSMIGFGGAFTDASCKLFSTMQPGARHALLSELFGHEGIGLSVGRIPIGSSDYSVSAYSYDDSETPDPQLEKFSIAHDRSYVLPMINEALAVNPEFFLFGAPWSPPGWMKTGNTLLGGAMMKKYMSVYAEYFVKFLLEYQKAGVHLQAVTSQNETDTHQDGRMPAAIWGQEYEAEFVRDHLAPALQRAGLDTKIWLLDHNYDLLGRVLDQLSDPALNKLVDGVAWHGYVGKPESMTKVHDAYPDKGTYWTEGGSFFDDPNYRTEWAKWGSTFAGIVNNWARLITVWNFVLDEQGRPNIGPFNCGGLVQLDSKTQELVRSGLFYGLGHYSKAVVRGAKVVETKGVVKGVDQAAFVNPSGERVVVLTNQAATTRVTLVDAGRQMEVELPADSVTTIAWA